MEPFFWYWYIIYYSFCAWQLLDGNSYLNFRTTERLFLSSPPVLPLAIVVAFKNIKPTLWGNPWKEPPRDVVDQGLDAVIRYLQDAERYGRRFSNRLKVVLVGLGSAGKTSLANRLEGRDGDSLPGEDERTVGVEIRDIHLEPSPVSHPQHSGQDLAVKLWDFAGQQAYYDTHQVCSNTDFRTTTHL